MRATVGIAAAAAYAVVALLQLLAIANGWSELRTLTQALVMPLLLVFANAPIVEGGVEVPMRGRDRIGLSLAIALSWAGDVLPRLADGEAAFVWMLFLFLLAQLAWSWELLSRFERSALFRARGALLLYVAAAAIVISACIPGAGLLAGLLPFYAAAVLSSAVLATGVGTAGTIGGILFLVANAMLGLFEFVLALDPGEPVKSMLIMSAYMSAQALIVWGVRRSIRREARVAEAIIATADEDAAAAPARPAAAGGHLTPLPGPETRARSRGGRL